MNTTMHCCQVHCDQISDSLCVLLLLPQLLPLLLLLAACGPSCAVVSGRPCPAAPLSALAHALHLQASHITLNTTDVMMCHNLRQTGRTLPDMVLNIYNVDTACIRCSCCYGVTACILLVYALHYARWLLLLLLLLLLTQRCAEG
jgi:hypothetical protein